ncbi:MAG: hypothetical protein HY268_27715, partial [Deltaproteobacteria bacterium]|nr:hypothetical protein [Deltaproteobacteria bacterium]
MNTQHTCKVMVLSVTLLLAGCASTTGGRSYGYPSYETADPYYRGTSDPYYGGTSDPYYGGTSTPGYDPYYEGRSHAEEHHDLAREHEEQHEQLEHQYKKAMNRLDRQEHEAEEKLNRKYGGNPADPQYQQEQ